MTGGTGDVNPTTVVIGLPEPHSELPFGATR